MMNFDTPKKGQEATRIDLDSSFISVKNIIDEIFRYPFFAYFWLFSDLMLDLWKIFQKTKKSFIYHISR